LGLRVWQEAQVDWYEAVAILGGEARKLQLFAMRSMASGDAYHRAYTHATQQALLEAHEHAFAYFGGVFRTLRYDNLGSAVKKILRGYQTGLSPELTGRSPVLSTIAKLANTSKSDRHSSDNGRPLQRKLRARLRCPYSTT
jgi:hypothetical protein